jgi:hypothetical protein
MGVNGNPRVRVTAVIGDTSKNVHGRPSSRPIRDLRRWKNKAKASQEREAFERRIENELGFQLAV